MKTTTERFSRAQRWIVISVGAVLFGVCVAISDVIAGGLGQTEVTRAISMILNAGSTWAAVAFWAGWMVKGRILYPSLAGAGAMVLAVLAYYGYGVLFGDRYGLGVAIVTPLFMWLLVALVAGPVLGWLGGCVHRSGWLGVLSRLIIPLGVLAEFGAWRYLRIADFRIEFFVASVHLLLIVGSVSVIAVVFWQAMRSRKKGSI